MSELGAYRKRVNVLMAEYQRAVADVAREEAELNGVRRDLGAVLGAQEIVQRTAQFVQQKVHEKISGIVTMCLDAVFDDPYQFGIRFDRKRGKTEARMVFSRDGNEFDDAMNEIGGGVVNVASFALRVACILMSRPPLRRLLVLDEPFGMIRGEHNKARTKFMLEKLVDDLGFQIVLTSDIKEYQLGSVIRLGDED